MISEGKPEDRGDLIEPAPRTHSERVLEAIRTSHPNHLYTERFLGEDDHSKQDEDDLPF